MSAPRPSAHAPDPAVASDAQSGTAALLGVLFRHAPIGMALWDAELRYVRINEVLAAINGRSAEDTVGRTLPEVLGELGDELVGRLRRLLATGEPLVDLEVSGELPSQPGVIRHWRASYYPVPGPKGPIGVAAAIIEVTAERDASAREQLALGEARAAGALLDALVDAAPVAIGFWNAELRYERLNRAMAELNGVPVEQHLGRTPEEVMGKMGAEVMACLRRAITTGEPVLDLQLTGAIAGRPGHVQHREGSWFPIFAEDGRAVGVGGVSRDVTERHQVEAERARLLEDALTARAHAEAARVRSEDAQQVAEQSRREADVARDEAERAGRAAEAARDRTQFLVDAGSRMAASMDYTATLQALARTAVPLLADWCSIATREPGGELTTQAVAHFDPAKTQTAWELIERYPPDPTAAHGPGRVIRTGEPELIAEIAPELLVAAARDEEHLAILHELALRSSLVVPLRAPGVTLGALSLILAESGRSFSEDDVALALALADRAALHIRNAQLYTERSHIARALQAGLLPRALPDIPGVEVAARYMAAGAHNEVGGDFYDIFHAEDDVWTALIGDVAGKGPEAAAITSMARHTLRTSALHVRSPSRNLATLNRALMADIETTRFCTVLYTRICPGAGSALLTFANGGHLPPRLLRSGRAVETVEVGGTLVGAVDDAHFEEVDLRLHPGDLVLMFTDGVTEVRGRPPDYGERQLDDALAALAGASAEEVVEAVLQRALEMHGGEPRDDIALVAIRVPAPDAAKDGG